MTEPGHGNVRYERSDVDAAALLRFGLILLLSTVAVVLLLWRLYHVFLEREARRQPPPPRLDPPRAWARMVASCSGRACLRR